MKKRVKIPVYNVDELLDLARRIHERHKFDGEGSPLKILDWETFGSMIENTLATQQEALRLKREMLLAFQKRDQQLQYVLSMVRRSRDVLTGVYHDDHMRSLGQWGFDVFERSKKGSAKDELSEDVKN